MRRALLILAACGGAQPPAPGDAHWLEGRWHGAQRDAYWHRVGGVLWGVAIDDRGFEVAYVDGTPRTLTSLEDGDHPRAFGQRGAGAQEIVFAGAPGTVRFARTANGWRGERLEPDGPSHTFDVAHADLPRAPAIEQADLEFAADTAKDGAAGWARHFDEHGAMWRRDHRVEGAAIAEAMTATLAAGALTWRPVTSGAHADLGFTLGTAEFTEPGGAPEALTYCTIWKHEPDGSWKVLFDIGRPAT